MYSASSHSRSLLSALRLPSLGPSTVSHLAGLYRQRQALKDLDAHLLADIGLTEAEAEAEARRPVWDVPKAWRL